MDSLARDKGHTFRDIQYATWREDWPGLREKAIQKVRSRVQNASQGDGTAIVIPARTTKGGRAEEWLSGLDYLYNGKGFAPHPKYEQWMEEQILKALNYFNGNKHQQRLIRDAPSTHNSH